MNGTPDNIIVNSCELTPIYLIQDSGVAQATSYVLTPANQVEQKPVSNLKRFYESSGNLEKSVLLNSPEPPAAKPRILKKVDSGQIGNNLKLASFLVPKTSAHNVQTKPVHTVNTVTTVNTITTVNTMNNIVFKPATATVAATSQNVPLTMTHAVPKLDMDRKIVKLKPSDTASRHFRGRSVPKIKPKEVTPEPPKYTSVQLLKLGETYHSLNVLSDDQVKMVNQALNIIKDPEKIPPEPAYDPVTNTRFIYKVVSPKDLKVVGRNKVALKEPRRLAASLDARPVGAVITRSGRKVRLPRQVVQEEPHKPRRRPGTVVTCAQCSTDFGSLYQLQKHYESQPTHAPSKTHWSLFHCLLAIVAGSPAEARAKLFVQQLELLVRKLKALLPCLLAGAAEGGAPAQPADIGDDVGRLFGLSSGKYHLDMEALSCVKDKEGHCEHQPAPAQASASEPSGAGLADGGPGLVDGGKPSQRWRHQHRDDCARVHTAHAWPALGSKLQDIKQKTHKNHVKKMRLAPDSEIVELNREDLIGLGANGREVPVPQKMISLLKNEMEPETKLDKPQTLDEIKKPKGHVQFHSAHFDIRSSPIKPSTSTVFRTFQINPDKMEKFNVQIIRPLELDQKPNEVIKETPTTSDCTKLDSIFRDEIEMSCKDVINNELNNGLNFNSSKDWAISSANDDQSHESFIKSNAVIEPSLIHVKDDAMGSLPDGSLTYSHINQNADMPVLTDEHDTQDSRLNLSQNQSVLNFLETLGNELTYPEPEIRNAAVDFQLDLFSFNNT
ncbi:uncharacterized protein LOC134806794 [Cydia splendana]|uniref:uncharacterized protein LOC134806794 n=1 Tax=Cydia splendana TaxID=1100963 RepID=UPI0021433DEA